MSKTVASKHNLIPFRKLKCGDIILVNHETYLIIDSRLDNQYTELKTDHELDTIKAINTTTFVLRDLRDRWSSLYKIIGVVQDRHNYLQFPLLF